MGGTSRGWYREEGTGQTAGTVGHGVEKGQDWEAGWSMIVKAMGMIEAGQGLSVREKIKVRMQFWEMATQRREVQEDGLWKVLKKSKEESSI